MAREEIKPKKKVVEEPKAKPKQKVEEPKKKKVETVQKHVKEVTKKVEAKVKDKKLSTKVKEAKPQINDRDEAKLVKALRSKSESSQEKEQYEEYLHMFSKLKTSIRMFERELKFSKSTRNVYALIALYSQQREVIADIRSITDYTENVNRIMTSLIQPLFSNITQSNLDIFYHIRKLMIEVSKDDQTQYALKRLEDLMREQGKYLQDKYENASEKLVQIVSDGK